MINLYNTFLNIMNFERTKNGKRGGWVSFRCQLCVGSCEPVSRRTNHELSNTFLCLIVCYIPCVELFTNYLHCIQHVQTANANFTRHS
jgi:hypothetical protein